MIDLVNGILNENTKLLIKSSPIYQVFYNKTHANKLAVAGKRLDICANEFAIYLLHSGRQKYVLRDKVCLEIGSGWLLTHSLLFYLLGAKKIYATDLEPLLQSDYISNAVCRSVEWSIIDSLSTFEDRELIQYRLNKLLSVKKFTVEKLQEFGIEYIAPIDLSQRMPNDEKLDFIFSKSVLEHVPIDDIVPLFQSLVSGMSEDGFMFHLIHLSDHRDLSNKPFDFLIYSQEEYPRSLQTRWGNRIRRSQWRQLFYKFTDLDFKFVFEWSCNDKKLPDKIDSCIQYIDEEDLRVSHIGVYMTRKNNYDRDRSASFPN